MRIPADTASKIPSTMRATGELALYRDEIPIPTAMPSGVVNVKHTAINTVNSDLNPAY
jgi:hypothetical protein